MCAGIAVTVVTRFHVPAETQICEPCFAACAPKNLLEVVEGARGHGLVDGEHWLGGGRGVVGHLDQFGGPARMAERASMDELGRQRMPKNTAVHPTTPKVHDIYGQ